MLAFFPLVQSKNLDSFARHTRCEKCLARRRQLKRLAEPPQRRADRCAAANKRRAIELQRMPAWADEEAMGAIYFEAARLTAKTGKKHQVRHIEPLQHGVVCGLHVPANLQIISAIENLRKDN